MLGELQIALHKAYGHLLSDLDGAKLQYAVTQGRTSILHSYSWEKRGQLDGSHDGKVRVLKLNSPAPVSREPSNFCSFFQARLIDIEGKWKQTTPHQKDSEREHRWSMPVYLAHSS